MQMRLVFVVMCFCFAFPATAAKKSARKARATRTSVKRIVVVPQNEKIDFEGLSLEGEVKAPGEFYFQARNPEKFDDLSKRKPNFRREMLRDAVISQ
jgi:hypothetical protein